MNAPQPPPQPPDPTLFDQPSGAELRDRGISAVLAADTAAHRGFRPDVERVIDALIASGTEFSADTVWDRLPADVQERISPNVVSAVFRIRSNQGAIRSVGVAKSTRPRRRCGIQLTWVGTDHAGQHQEAS